MNNGISVTGRLRIDAMVGDRLEPMYEEDNLIVDNGFSKMATLLAFGAVNNSVLALGSIVVGFNPSPLAPATSDTVGITSWALGYAWDAPVTLYTSPSLSPLVSTTSPYSVSLVGTLGGSQGNTSGMVTEEAVYLTDGTLFAKKTFNVPKASTYTLLFTHTFSFARTPSQALFLTIQSGATGGGTTLVLAGPYLVGKTVTGVQFGSTAGTSVSSNATLGTAQVTTPAHTAGVVSVSVTTSDLATYTLPAAFLFL